MMPDMDGPATLLALRAQEETRAIPVIFLTAKVQGVDRRSFLTLGVQGIIAKPFDPMNLGEQIREALGWE
jgi:CheY-like chemotaxis protein